MSRKNIIFYSDKHPQCSQFMNELKNNKGLRSQFICILVDNPSIKLPPLIKNNINSIPILIAAGFNEPICQNAAISWIKQSAKNTLKNVPPDGGNGSPDQIADFMDSGSLGFGMLTDINGIDLSRNKDKYNMDVMGDNTIGGSNFSSVQNTQTIEAFTDKPMKQNQNDIMNEKLSHLRNARNNDATIMRPISRIGT